VWVLGDSGHPQLISTGTGELAVDQVPGGRLGRNPRRNLGRPVAPCRPGAAHQLYSVEANRDAAPRDELGVDPPAPIGLPGGGVDLEDGPAPTPSGQSWEPRVCQQLRGCGQDDRDQGWIQRRLAAKPPVQRLDCRHVGGHGNENDRADGGLQDRG
jgi:hypothetical protein